MVAKFAPRAWLKPLALSAVTAFGLALGGCAYYDDYYDGYRYGYYDDGYYGPAYSIWYDGYYGPYYGGYWARDGYFYYSDRYRNRHFRDRGHHFRRHHFSGARRYHHGRYDGRRGYRGRH